MAMTPEVPGPAGPEPERLLDCFDPEDLDGHTMEELGDYLDAGRRPADAGIDNSPGCLIALDALSRLRSESWAMLEVEALADRDRDQSWIANVIANISRESRAGRDIPVGHPDPATRLNISEGAVRGLVRAAGDGVGGSLIGRVHLDGDVSASRAPITVAVTASVAFGPRLDAVAQLIRDRIADALLTHTELNVVAIDVEIRDVHDGGTTGDRP
jgi:uncharacterized alkaline shock family protein YloU